MAEAILMNRNGLVAKSIVGATVRLKQENLIYDGGVKTQVVEQVSFGDTVLTEGLDYIVLNNSAVNRGSYRLGIQGIHTYDSIKYVDWIITYKIPKLVINAPENKISMETSGSTSISFEYDGDGVVSAQSSAPAIVNAQVQGNNINLTSNGFGSAIITVEAPETQNYEAAQAQFSVEVTKRKGSLTLNEDLVLIKGPMGTEKVITMSHVGDGEITIEMPSSSAAIATYAEDKITIRSVKAGNAIMVVNMAETDNYTGASAQFSVTVEKADGSLQFGENSVTIKGPMGTTGQVVLTKVGDGVLTITNSPYAIAEYSDRNLVITSVKAGNGIITVNMDETENYTSASASVSVVVQKGDGSISVMPTRLEVSGPAGTIGYATLEYVGDGDITIGTSAYATLSREGKQISVTSVGSGSSNVQISIAETENYKGASCMLEIVVSTISPILEENSWEVIAEVAANGNASSTWRIGDTKAFTIGSETYHAQIIGFDHDDLDSSDAKYSDSSYNGGKKKAAITFQMKECLTQDYRMDETSDNSCSWRDSEMRVTTMPKIKEQFDQTAVAVMRTVTKSTAHSQTDSTIYKTADVLFLLCHTEVFETQGNSHPGEGTQYAFYLAGNSKIKKYLSGSAAWWWLRSPSTYSSTNFRFVYADGTTNSNDATNNYAVAAGFCV